MPSFDSGYYQLTSLIPILQDGEDHRLWRWQPQLRSASHSLRELLDSFRSVDLCDAIPAQEAPRGEARPVLFSTNDRTHFARLLVVDDLAYNGRRQGDTLIGVMRDLLASNGWTKVAIADRENVDHLPHPYLLVVLDFDAPNGHADSVETYLRELWATMEQEWTLILRHCRGFELEPRWRERSFVSLILDHEIESTFTFTAYPWAAAKAERWQPSGHAREPSKGRAPLRRLRQILSLLLLIGGLVALLMSDIPIWRIGLIALLIGLTVLPLVWQQLLRRANRPWPSQPGTDLRSVLKALYLQGAFLEMAEAWQNRDPARQHSLRRHFRDFLHDVKPRDLDDPSLRPGRIHAIRRSNQP